MFPKFPNVYLEEIQRQLSYYFSLEKLVQALCIKSRGNDNCGKLLLTLIFQVTSLNVSETTATQRIKPLLLLGSSLDFNF